MYVTKHLTKTKPSKPSDSSIQSPPLVSRSSTVLSYRGIEFNQMFKMCLKCGRPSTPLHDCDEVQSVMDLGEEEEK